MKMIPFQKSLKMSISLHFAYMKLIHAYIHLQCQAYPFDVSKVNKFIENLVKLFKAISFLVINRTIQLPLVNSDP